MHKGAQLYWYHLLSVNENLWLCDGVDDEDRWCWIVQYLISIPPKWPNPSIYYTKKHAPQRPRGCAFFIRICIGQPENPIDPRGPEHAGTTIGTVLPAYCQQHRLSSADLGGATDGWWSGWLGVTRAIFAQIRRSKPRLPGLQRFALCFRLATVDAACPQWIVLVQERTKTVDIVVSTVVSRCLFQVMWIRGGIQPLTQSRQVYCCAMTCLDKEKEQFHV